jgi:radical SAM superfamily enzyme YgiQ (UPF0313 family)
MPDYGMPLIGSILSKRGYDVKVYMEHIKSPEWNRIEVSDIICFSSFTAGADKTYRLADEIKSRLGIPTIIGGTHASYFPESCLQHCSYVVFGEGDETIVQLIETLEQGGDIEQVAGIAYRIGNQVRRTAPRPGPTKFDTIPSLSLIEGYRRMSLFDILVQRKNHMVTVQSSRGCNFKCTFCIVNTMFPGGYRKRNIESVILDLKEKRQYSRNLLFVDNEFAALRPYTKKLLRRIIEEDFGFQAIVLTRVEVAKDDELLSLMREAGIVYIFQGYESVQPETLTAYDKRQNITRIIGAIQKLHAFGFGILGSFVVGADTDTLETVRCTVEFVLEQRLMSAFIYPIWGHYPEQKNGYQPIIPWYRSIFRGWRYCDGHFVTHFPLHMPPSNLQRAIIEAYRRIYSLPRIVRALKDRQFDEVRRNALLRYQCWAIEKGTREYISFLEELEEGLYDSDGHLCEDLLVQRVKKDPRWTFQAGNLAIEAFGLAPPELPISEKPNVTCARQSF